MMSRTAVVKDDTERHARNVGMLLVVVILSALFYYKWGGSLRVLGKLTETGQLALSPQALIEGGIVATTRFYFGKIWPALTYGILLGAAVQATIPTTWVKRWLGAGAARPTFLGALVGAPLMLCSCCVTPLFTGLHQRGARLGPSLAVMLASPGLNVAALVLTFALLPMRVAALRLAGAAFIVFALPVAVARSMAPPVRALEADACPVPVTDEATAEGNASDDGSLRAVGIRFARSIVTMAAITVPLILFGVLGSGLLMPYVTKLTTASMVLSVAVVALVAVLVALPTFFEIPVAIMLLAAGAPQGVAVAFVVAGPIVNLASLLVLGRETRPRIALAVAAGVWVVATVTGLVAGA